jgi:hypothetical protein
MAIRGRLPDDPRTYSRPRWFRVVRALPRETVVALVQAAGRQFGLAREGRQLIAGEVTKGRLIMWVLQVPGVAADTAAFMQEHGVVPRLSDYAGHPREATEEPRETRDVARVEAALGPLGSLEESTWSTQRPARQPTQRTPAQRETRKRRLAGLPTIYESC